MTYSVVEFDQAHSYHRQGCVFTNPSAEPMGKSFPTGGRLENDIVSVKRPRHEILPDVAVIEPRCQVKNRYVLCINPRKIEETSIFQSKQPNPTFIRRSIGIQLS